MSLSERKMEVLNAIEDFLESLVGEEYYLSASSCRDGDYEIDIVIPKEAFCVKESK